MRKLSLTLIIYLSLITTACGSNANGEDISQILHKGIKNFYTHENAKFHVSSIIHMDDKMASVNLKGLEFIGKGHAYYIGSAGGQRVELYQKHEKLMMKNIESQWVSLDEGGATQLEMFINSPSLLLDFVEYGEEFILLDNSYRLQKKNHTVFSFILNDEGVEEYVNTYLPGLKDEKDEISIEMTIYLDNKNDKVSKIDIFLNEPDGSFSLVSELIIVDYNVKTDVTIH